MNNLVVFTGPVRSGKTTALWERFATQAHTGGFLTPDKDGQRFFYDLAGKQWLPFELGAESEVPAVEIGRFKFSEETFCYGRKLLLAPPVCDWFIVDEAGRLEVEKEEGWAPALPTLIEQYKAGYRQGKLLLVVRDTLLEKAVEKWGLHQAILLSDLEEGF